MDMKEFRQRAHELVDWMADYLENIEQYPVKSQVQPREILDSLPSEPPESGESFDDIMRDFETVIMPGITHWQHPKYMAYFTANSSPPSVLGEMLTSTIAAQTMIWQTSPAAAELEERMMQWLIRMLGLPAEFSGVIQDTASTATLCSLLTAREQHSRYRINAHGFDPQVRYSVYASTETHSSVEKAVKIAGFGQEAVRKVAVNDKFAMDPQALERAIDEDRRAGWTPLAVVATVGTTGSTAIDPVRAIGEICNKHGLWYHIDAAYAGTALILPEMRSICDGVELADTFVFNPHKWMGVNFDCTAYFVKDEGALIQTFEIMPEYLRTSEEAPVKNYRDWGIQLGRRFRALKLWFVIRSYGVDGLRRRIRKHLDLARNLAKQIELTADFELLAPVSLALVCFRYHPEGVAEQEMLDNLNERLIEAVNASGKVFLTHTRLNGLYTVRLVTSQTYIEQRHVDEAWALIQETARSLSVSR